MNQLALQEEPTAVEARIESAIATGTLPSFYRGYQRRGEYTDRKRWPIERMARACMDRFAAEFGVLPDSIACSPENVAALQVIEGVRILRRPIVRSGDDLYLGHGGL